MGGGASAPPAARLPQSARLRAGHLRGSRGGAWAHARLSGVRRAGRPAGGAQEREARRARLVRRRRWLLQCRLLETLQAGPLCGRPAPHGERAAGGHTGASRMAAVGRGAHRAAEAVRRENGGGGARGTRRPRRRHQLASVGWWHGPLHASPSPPPPGRGRRRCADAHHGGSGGGRHVAARGGGSGPTASMAEPRATAAARGVGGDERPRQRRRRLLRPETLRAARGRVRASGSISAARGGSDRRQAPSLPRLRAPEAAGEAGSCRWLQRLRPAAREQLWSARRQLLTAATPRARHAQRSSASTGRAVGSGRV